MFCNTAAYSVAQQVCARQHALRHHLTTHYNECVCVYVCTCSPACSAAPLVHPKEVLTNMRGHKTEQREEPQNWTYVESLQTSCLRNIIIQQECIHVCMQSGPLPMSKQQADWAWLVKARVSVCSTAPPQQRYHGALAGEIHWQVWLWPRPWRNESWCLAVCFTEPILYTHI